MSSLTLDLTMAPKPSRAIGLTPKGLASLENRKAQARFHRQVIARDGNRCTKCGRLPHELAGVYPDLRMLIADHITPKKLGGTDDVTNGQTHCFFCDRKFGWRARYKIGERVESEEEQSRRRAAYFAEREEG